MAKVKSATQSSKQKRRPALTPEAREQQMIALAVDCAEQQLMDGTASSQVITFYLKLATEKARLENEKLKEENKLLIARTEAIKAIEERDSLYKDAIAAMRRYSGQGDTDDED